MVQAEITHKEFQQWLYDYFTPSSEGEVRDYSRVANTLAGALGIEFAPEPTPADDEPGTVRMSPVGPAFKQHNDEWRLYFRSASGGIEIRFRANDHIQMDWPIVAQVPVAATPTAAQQEDW